MTRLGARVLAVAALVPVNRLGRVRVPLKFRGARPFANRVFRKVFRRGVRVGWKGWAS